ncbi:hypothetical protein QFZ71_003403 [Streptomyces sp. V2I9]|nr:hypothetical protein [Streptomyces sp. V2I9]
MEVCVGGGRAIELLIIHLYRKPWRNGKLVVRW